MICVIITDEAPFNGALNLAKKLGEVSAVVVGSQSLADKVAVSGVKELYFAKAELAEVKAEIVAKKVAELAPKFVLTSGASGARVLGAFSAKVLSAALIDGVIDAKFDGANTIIEQSDLGGRVINTLSTDKNVVGFYKGSDDESVSEGTAVAINVLEDSGYDISVKTQNLSSGTSGLLSASRVVGFGRGVKSKDDISLINSLAAAMGAEVGCSMPIADDLGWMPKECYVGRSGQQISPRVYVAVGISGAPQHLEGVRGAKVVVAINKDPDARIFRSADYGIVGDLYEIVPALEKAVKN
ncbi:electron transfer flavoprotein subunit alpha/FixB family protein [Campylobacter sp.]|uniref:electron transfer flavoprotein subunit alpha/FixB family protein n=1 Tax=Campylobacter sp. TaxID=205 RepID=UPI002914BC23|nr:electron transfer flavoprotein subunit alpha/FixB family protein [Campylobacter sp.]MDU6828395.1 electron transfer flavoprotein subunit alpha/FixB family protein [Campylobacter sp.]